MIEAERALAGRQRTSVSALNGHAVSIMEERPPWDGSPGAWTRHGVARFRYLRSRIVDLQSIRHFESDRHELRETRGQTRRSPRRARVIVNCDNLLLLK